MKDACSGNHFDASVIELLHAIHESREGKTKAKTFQRNSLGAGPTCRYSCREEKVTTKATPKAFKTKIKAKIKEKNYEYKHTRRD